MPARLQTGLSAWRVAGTFSLHALAIGAIMTRIPDVQLRLGVGEGALGLVLMVGSVGALLSFFVSAPAIARFGTRRVLGASLSLTVVMAASMSVLPTLATVAAAQFLLGAGATVAAVAGNVEADRFELATERRVMNTSHGIWSLTFLAVSLLGAWLRGAGVSQAQHLWLHAAAVLVFLAIVLVPMAESPERPSATRITSRRLALPTAATLALVGFALGSELLEGSARAWSIIFLRDTFSTTALIEGLALPAFTAAMTLARLTTDRRLRTRAPARVARLHVAVAAAGVIVLGLAPGPGWALAGFALVGYGVGVVNPMTISAAARTGDRPAAENVAAITLAFQVIALGAPVLIGGLAEAASIRLAFVALLPLVAVGLWRASVLDR